MSNILFLKDAPDHYLLEIKKVNKTIKTLYVFKSFDNLKDSILISIENKIKEKYKSPLNREGSYLLKKEIDESLDKKMIHLNNLSLENNKNITIFEIFTKDLTLTLDNFNKDYIEELVDNYKLDWVEGSFEAYKSLNLYQAGLIFKLKDKSSLNEDLKISLEYGENNLSIDNLKIKDKGKIILDYEIINGLLKINNIKTINSNTSSQTNISSDNKNMISNKLESKVNNFENTKDFKVSKLKFNNEKIE